MWPFFDDVISPILRAARAQRVLEIGVRRGATTAQVLEQLGQDVELHAIDPVPDFDATELERTFPGRYILHADTSHNVLPDLPPVDVALIDGDHNWFTVYHELRLLGGRARDADKMLPILILHDVAWPYGRRDLYYEPARIPPEFRQEYAQRGIQPGRPGFAAGNGGINAMMHNAVTEGGPRNGVMTAVEDFVAEYDRPLRVVVLPIYFGLAIVAEEARLADNPELRRVLDWVESTEGKHRLLQLSESIRLRGVVHQHNVASRATVRFERAAVRYLDLLKDSLLDGAVIDKVARQQLDHLERCLDLVRADEIAGDLVECTAEGSGAMFMRGYLDVYELDGHDVWASVADTLLDAPIEAIALLRVAPSPSAAVGDVLEALYGRVTTGGVVMIDDCSTPSSEHAVTAFRDRHGIDAPLTRNEWAGVSWRKRTR